MKKEIVIGKSGPRVLSDAQKKFNTLTEKVNKYKLKLEISNAQSELLQKKHLLLIAKSKLKNDKHAERLFIVDGFLDNEKPSAADRKIIKKFIITMTRDLLSQSYLDDALIALHDKHSVETYDQINKEVVAAEIEEAKSFLSFSMGIEIPDDVVFESIDDMKDYVLKHLEDVSEQKEIKKAKRKEKADAKKSEKQKEKEAIKQNKEKEETYSMTKTVRSLYMELVKAFHPDREQDENEKLRKTEVMKKVVVAYEDNDLITLLQLQLDLENKASDHLDALTDNVLTHYNKILKKQIDELDESIFMIKMQTFMKVGYTDIDLEWEEALQDIDEEIEEEASKTYAITNHIQELLTKPNAMKEFAKGCRIIL